MANANASVSRRITLIAASLWLTARSASATQPHSNDWATQGFFFSWNDPNAVLPTPITAQCETLNINWNRAAGTGPDPIPPYYLRVYSSAVNNTVDSFQLVPAGTMAATQLTIPFPPGTMYVICMTDSVGVSGGCQNLYTVYPSPTFQSCSNFTAPAKVLGMKVISLATQSTASRWGWPASCTDLELQPTDDANGGIKGTPPYTLSVSSGLRPPLNITFDESVKWTITLAHGAPFFLSVSDANGVTWTEGPMHAGAGDKSCLLDSIPSSGLSAPSTIGAAVGSFFLGGILAVILFWLVVRRHRNQRPTYNFDSGHSSPLDNSPPRRETNRPTFTPLAAGGIADIHSYSALSNSNDSRSRKRPTNYGPLDSNDPPTPNLARQRTPDAHSSPPGSSIPLRTTRRNSASSHFSAASPTNTNPPTSASNPSGGQVHEVFVVHHDGGAPPPVTVYALPGSRVTELPPGYADFGGRSPENAARPSQPQLALLGDHPSPASASPSYFSHRDQKAAYTPRPAPPPSSSFSSPPTTFSSPPTTYSPPPTTYSPPPDPPSPQPRTPDQRGRAVTPTRVLPSTPHLQPPTPIKQTHSMSDSITSRNRGPRPMSPPDDTEQQLWK